MMLCFPFTWFYFNHMSPRMTTVNLQIFTGRWSGWESTPHLNMQILGEADLALLVAQVDPLSPPCSSDGQGPLFMLWHAELISVMYHISCLSIPSPLTKVLKNRSNPSASTRVKPKFKNRVVDCKVDSRQERRIRKEREQNKTYPLSISVTSKSQQTRGRCSF